MPSKTPVILTLAIDVEEEGLFSGHYHCFPSPPKNTAFLHRLLPFMERGIRPTLFCAYASLADKDSRAIIEKLAPSVEIGAHLHHWNTEPLIQNLPANGVLATVPAAQVPLSILEKKLRSLLRLCASVSERPITSFRMGRWDLQGILFPILINYGIKCDASVRPYHCGRDAMKGPNHFMAPSDPYWIRTSAGNILEVPLTALPVSRVIKPFKKLLQSSPFLSSTFHKWGLHTLLPVQHPLWLLKMTTRKHMEQGGRVCSLTWHSSEMMPGGTPHLASKDAIDRFLDKIAAYLDWLENEYDTSYKSIGELCHIQGFEEAVRPDTQADWCV